MINRAAFLGKWMTLLHREGSAVSPKAGWSQTSRHPKVVFSHLPFFFLFLKCYSFSWDSHNLASLLSYAQHKICCCSPTDVSPLSEHKSGGSVCMGQVVAMPYTLFLAAGPPVPSRGAVLDLVGSASVKVEPIRDRRCWHLFGRNIILILSSYLGQLVCWEKRVCSMMFHQDGAQLSGHTPGLWLVGKHVAIILVIGYFLPAPIWFGYASVCQIV